MKKICPQCNKRYYENKNYCGKCAVKLEFDRNRCNEPKSTYCEYAICDDDDIVCTYCGAPTVYAAERAARK